MEKYCRGVLFSRCQADNSLISQADPQHKSFPAQSKDFLKLLPLRKQQQ